MKAHRLLSCFLLLLPLTATAFAAPPAAPAVYPIESGFVDTHGVLLYYEAVGRGEPLVFLHGGPGASHEYLLPQVLPLARHNRLIFFDQRGSGKSTHLDDPAGYTVEAMVEDVEAVRQALHLGSINLLGHSYGGVLAQAYALKYEKNLRHLVLCSTFASTRAINEILAKMKAAMPAEARTRLEQLEAAGLYGKGKPWEKGRYPAEYMTLAWGDGYFPFLYQRHADANYDPAANGVMAWDLYREMWGSHGEFVIDGNLRSVEYGERLHALKVPTLVTAGDHDESDPTLATALRDAIPGAKRVIFPESGHMTFVDQPVRFVQEIDAFLHP
jgi:proline iminopeptidase